ncbi:hypothetical protein [Oceanibaculum nanhaiense]|uniref:hypothetical protein n=1 Tax=Oceanibaculum nanhaiense TaxID=1909734 RepID=UPI003D2D7876
MMFTNRMSLAAAAMLAAMKDLGVFADAAGMTKGLAESFADAPEIRYERGARHRGWGARKTLDTHHRKATSSRYTGAIIRQLNAERGVGRPPKRRAA